MSAWKEWPGTAPHDTDILVRFEDDECPVVLKHVTYDDGSWSGWIWVDDLLQEACDPPVPEECAGAKWAPIPE